MSYPLFPIPATLLYCLVATAAMVYVPFLVVVYGRVQIGNDTAAPRALFDKLPAYAQRATWAHQNSWEALTLFAPAVLMAYVTQVDAPLAAQVAIAHVLARSLYPLFYILNVPLLRSLMFLIGTLGTMTLFGLSVLKVSG